MMKTKLSLAILAIFTLLMGCSKDENNAQNAKGYVFTMSNAISGNELLQYKINADGVLSLIATVPTTGLGTGSNLSSQGSLILSANKEFIFAVNAGDHSISTFGLLPTGAIAFVGKYNLQGIRPISITQRGDLVYVLCNEGAMGASSIEGFTLSTSGVLTAIPNSKQAFPNDVNPAQISFVQDGVLVVSERATNLLTSFTLNPITHIPTLSQSLTTSHVYPYGFAVNSTGQIFVTEASASSSVSSYSVSADAVIASISTLSNAQGGACWAAINSTSTICYSSNANANTISSFAISAAGALTATQTAVELGAGNSPLEIVLSSADEYLYVLAGTSDKILPFKVEDNTLTPIACEPIYVPGAAYGLAVY
jgi:6-phosphogluconolactonase (cycloisomerase 2 family)